MNKALDMASSDFSAASPAALFFRSITKGREDGRRGTGLKSRHHPYSLTSTQSKRPAQNVGRATVNVTNCQKLQEIRKSVEETDPSIWGSPLSGYGFFDYLPSSAKPHRAPDDRSRTDQHSETISRTLPPSQLSFRKGAFYTIQESITDVKICDVTNVPRTISFTVSCEDGSALQKRINDPSYQVGIFCAGGLEDVQDIRFPDGSRIKVDGLEGTVSFGRKNKPGFVMPIDISKGLRLCPGPTHTVELTYGPTTNEFYLVIFLCKKRSIEEAVDDITKREKISATSIHPDPRCIAHDPSIVATSQVLTLMCPLSQKRLEFPCRGLNCKHWQCFDATTYIQLQEQSPQWECPICYTYLPFDALVIDGHMENILRETPKSQERVAIDADGKWHTSPSNRWSPSIERYSAPVVDLTLSGDDEDP